MEENLIDWDEYRNSDGTIDVGLLLERNAYLDDILEKYPESATWAQAVIQDIQDRVDITSRQVALTLVSAIADSIVVKAAIQDLLAETKELRTVLKNCALLTGVLALRGGLDGVSNKELLQELGAGVA